ncbi:MAG: hypothetical protein OEZ06_15145 [Myxococcales bacterium]|nr:hypothetical protein [Myxococcales bacterium]
MSWTPREQDGLALASVICRDSGGQRAAAGIADSARDSALERAHQLASLDSRARRAWVRRALEPQVLQLDSATPHPPRALGLLAAELPREQGREAERRAPAPRPGFRAGNELRAVLRKLLQPPPEPGGARPWHD